MSVGVTSEGPTNPPPQGPGTVSTE
jgi:hypothetical protein